jgi:hypothetical protein
MYVRQRTLRSFTLMPKNSNAKEENSQSSKNIQIPPIRKQTAGAVAGAAAGSIAGPIGAVVGGVVGAAVGKAAEKGQPILPAASRTVRSAMRRSKAISKTVRRRGTSTKSSTKTRKAGARGGKAKKIASRRSTKTKSGKISSRSRAQSKSPGSARKRSGNRRKRH